MIDDRNNNIGQLNLFVISEMPVAVHGEDDVHEMMFQSYHMLRKVWRYALEGCPPSVIANIISDFIAKDSAREVANLAASDNHNG